MRNNKYIDYYCAMMAIPRKFAKNPKRVILMLMFILLIQGVIVNVSSNFIWGYHTINNPDEYRHFARARQIAYRNIKINEVWDDPQHYDLYPPGFHLFIASFMLLSNSYDVFLISIIYRILFSTVISLVIFMIGRKIKPWIGLLSMFFYNTFFFISTFVGRIGNISYKAPYPHIVSHQSYVAPYLITHLLVFIAILLYFFFVTGDTKRLNTYGVLLLVVLTVHGVSHISTYIGFVANFGFFYSLIMILSLFKKKNIMALKHGILLLILLLSSILTFFIYYFPLLPAILSSAYNPSHFLPPGISKYILSDFIIIFGVMIFLAPVLWIYFYRRIKYNISSPFHININQNILLLITPIYVFLYLALLYLVSTHPKDYNFSGFQLVNGIFPTYIPLKYDFISFYSMLIGFFMYILSLLSIYFSFKYSRGYAFLISIIYISFFMIWYFFVSIHYYADRIIYFMYILPFIYALGVYYFFSKFKVLPENKKILERKIKVILIIALLMLLLFTNTLTQFASDPPVRENMNVSSPLRMGVNNPPAITWSLSVATNFYTNKNEYILASIQPGEALAATTHIKPPTFQYNIIIKNHKEWSLRHLAYLGVYGAQKEFFEKYNARYLVIGVMDTTTGGEIPGQLAPIQKYNNSSHLLLIYAKGNGERIYLWVN